MLNMVYFPSQEKEYCEHDKNSELLNMLNPMKDNRDVKPVLSTKIRVKLQLLVSVGTYQQQRCLVAVKMNVQNSTYIRIAIRNIRHTNN